jgi:hypothetical protein
MTDGLGTASRAQTLDVVAVGEMAVDFIEVEQTDTLGNATTCREAFYRQLETPAEHRA